MFTLNARKEPVERPGGLPGDWRSVIPRQVDDLVAAWRDESAWSGRVSAGGVEMDAADNAVVALEELVVHGWDLSRATGQDFVADDASAGPDGPVLRAVRRADRLGKGPYGPEVPAPDDASRLESTIAHTGRDPHWSGVR